MKTEFVVRIGKIGFFSSAGFIVSAMNADRFQRFEDAQKLARRAMAQFSAADYEISVANTLDL